MGDLYLGFAVRQPQGYQDKARRILPLCLSLSIPHGTRGALQLGHLYVESDQTTRHSTYTALRPRHQALHEDPSWETRFNTRIYPSPLHRTRAAAVFRKSTASVAARSFATPLQENETRRKTNLRCLIKTSPSVCVGLWSRADDPRYGTRG